MQNHAGCQDKERALLGLGSSRYVDSYLLLRVGSRSRTVRPSAHLQTYLQAVVEKEEGDLLPSVTEVIA